MNAPTDPVDKATRWDDALRRVAECLDDSKMKYFVDCGTLLGAIREGDYIKWDNDIDLGLIDDKDCAFRYQSLAEKIHRNGFAVNLADSGFCCLMEPDVEINVTFYRRRGATYEATLYTANKRHTFISFLKYIRDGTYRATFGDGAKFRIKQLLLRNAWAVRALPDALLNHYAQVKAHVIRVPAHHLELGPRSFHGMELTFPIRPDDYLAFRYGADWRMPKQEYRLDHEDGALMKK